MIIETCPKCGSDLVESMICTMPPVRQKTCSFCGWSWESRPADVIRIPFNESEQEYQLTCGVQECSAVLNTDYNVVR